MRQLPVRVIAWMGFLAGLGATSLAAQERAPVARGPWSIGISRGVSTLSAGSVGETEDGVELRWAPYRPQLWGITAGYGREQWRVQLSARFGRAGLGARSEAVGALIVTEDAYQVLTAAVAVSTRLVRLRDGPVLRPSLGIEIESWTAVDEPSRTIAGVQGGLAIETRLVGPILAALEGELGYTPNSPFAPGQMPEHYRLCGTWRRTLAGSVSWRF